MKKSIEILDNICSDLNGQVNNSLGSLFTKDDVKSIIAKIALEFERVVNEMPEEKPQAVDMTDIREKVFSIIDETLNRLDTYQFVEIRKEEASFSINYRNKVEIDEIESEVDTDYLYAKITNAIHDAFPTNELQVVNEETEN